MTTSTAKSAPPPADLRTIIRAVLKASSDATDSYHHEARAFRNRLVIMTLLALTTASCMVLLQWRLPLASIVERPTGAEHIARWAVLLLVMAFGAIGALLTTIPAIAAIPRVQSPFNFPLQQAYLKILVGSLTAVAGVIVAGSAGLTTGYANLQALIGIAIVFGAGQQAVTQYLDKRAKQIIGSADSSP